MEAVILYITVPEEVPGTLRVCDIVFPFEAEAPVTPPVIVPIVQEKIEPEVLLVFVIFVRSPEHVLCEGVVAIALGSTFTVIAFEVPEHPFNVAVTL